MKKLLCGLALSLMTATALAQPAMHASAGQQPLLLSEAQMDGVTAGWSFLEIDRSNTSVTAISAYQTGTDPSGDQVVFGPGNTITCSSCYLLINNPALSVGSIILGGG